MHVWDLDYLSTSDEEDNDDESSDSDEENTEKRKKKSKRTGEDVVDKLVKEDLVLYKRDLDVRVKKLIYRKAVRDKIFSY